MSNNIFIVDLIISARKAIQYLFSKWLIILLVGFLAGVCGILYAWLKPPKYTAELIFSSENGSDNALGGYAGLAAQFGFDLGGSGGGAFQGDNLMELLKSQTILEQTLLSEAPGFGNNKLMIDAYLDNHKLNKTWSKDTLLSKVRFTKNPSAPNRARDSVMKAVCKGILETQLFIDKKDKKLNYIVVGMKDVNEVYAKDFVEQLVKIASNYFIEYKSQKARKNLQLVTRLTDSVKGLLYGNIENYASSNDLNVNPLRQVLRTGSQKIQVNAQANTALYTELLKQLGLAQLTVQKETPLIQIIDRPMLPLKKEKPGRLFTGIIFAFLGGVLTAAFLLLKRWIKQEFASNTKWDA